MNQHLSRGRSALSSSRVLVRGLGLRSVSDASADDLVRVAGDVLAANLTGRAAGKRRKKALRPAERTRRLGLSRDAPYSACQLPVDVRGPVGETSLTCDLLTQSEGRIRPGQLDTREYLQQRRFRFAQRARR